MILRKFQANAVEELLSHSETILSGDGDHSVVLQAPTGSGKTIMLADFINSVVENSDKDVCFVWMAPNTLHKQSKEKLEKYLLNERSIDCIEFDDVGNDGIRKNSVLFLNWTSVNSKNNKYLRATESRNSLEDVFSDAKNRGVIVIMIIDESHHTAESEKSREIINIIKPKMRINSSATPKPIQKNQRSVVVKIADVVSDEIIRKTFKINHNIIEEGGGNVNIKFSHHILDKGLSKREELLSQYMAAEENINPLLCIQIPNRIPESNEEALKEELINLLREKYDITVSNGKLSIITSEEDNDDRGSIVDNDNAVRVLIFKQSIAIGWDCPRAQVLVLYRHLKKWEFSTQTIGRFLRVPNPEIGHYNCDELNHAYIYTDKEINSESVNFDIYKDKFSVRVDACKNINIPSFKRNGPIAKTKISEVDFTNKLIKTCGDKKLASYLKIDGDISEFINTDKTVSSESLQSNATGAEDYDGEDMKIKKSHAEDIQEKFNRFCDECVANNASVINRHIMKNALYKYFLSSSNINYEEENGALSIHKIALCPGNQPYIKECVDKSCLDLSGGSGGYNTSPLFNEYLWNIPGEISLGGKDIKKLNVKKSAVMPFYTNKKTLSNIEGKFIRYLEESENVIWWYKNADSGADAFAVTYEKNNSKHLFFVDFIVMYQNGVIGLYDTKENITLDVAEYKIEGLREYISTNTNLSSKIYGGIITDNSNNESYGFKIYKGEGKNITADNPEDWAALDAMPIVLK